MEKIDRLISVAGILAGPVTAIFMECLRRRWERARKRRTTEIAGLLGEPANNGQTGWAIMQNGEVSWWKNVGSVPERKLELWDIETVDRRK